MPSRIESSCGRNSRRGALGRWALCALALSLPGTIPPTQAGPVTEVRIEELTPAQRERMSQWLGTLRDGQVDVIRRAQAARALYDAGWPAARAALRVDLAVAPDIGTQRAVALMLAGAPEPDAQFVPVLLELLAGSDDPLRSEAALALGRYDNADLTQRLATLAQEARRSTATRAAAVQALSLQRTQAAAGALMRLIEPNQPAALREAAFAGLMRLTGVREPGQDQVLWQRWWERHRGLSASAWTDMILANLDRTQSRLATQAQELQDRLLEAQEQLYRASTAERRPALLRALLGDELEPLRLLGIKLATQALGEVGPAGVTPEVKQLLLEKLDDAAPTVRQRAALLLRDLGEPAAADKVAQVVAGGEEPRPELLRAYLLVLKRMPRKSALPALLRLLEEPLLRKEAAAALTAAGEAQLMDAPQQAKARQAVRRQLEGVTAPDPALVALLGRVAETQDWNKIAQWLDNPEASVKEAAAAAWAAGDRPVEALVRRMEDPVILPIALATAAKRGGDGRVLALLAAYKPRTEALNDPWQRALIATAATAEAPAVLTAVQTLQARGISSELRVQALSAAVDRLLAQRTATQPAPAVTVELILARAAIHLSERDPRAALADGQRLLGLELKLTPAQMARNDMIVLEARLALGELEGVEEIIRRRLGPAARDTWAPAAGLLLQTAQTELKGNRLERAKLWLSLVRSAVTVDWPGDLVKRLESLEKAAGLTPAVATQPAPPSPATTPAPPTQPTGKDKPPG